MWARQAAGTLQGLGVPTLLWRKVSERPDGIGVNVVVSGFDQHTIDDFLGRLIRALRERFEPEEANPMIGYRGCFRYVKDPSLFRLELEVLARV